MKEIYADYNATTPLLATVKDYLQSNRLQGPFANPNSLHVKGTKIKSRIEKCRELIAQQFSLPREKIIFNSGSSESIATTFWMTIGQEILKKGTRTHILCSSIEHAAVIENALLWEKYGAKVHWLPTLANGVVDMAALNSLLDEHAGELALVAVMAANNETGIFQPYGEIAKLCKKQGVPYLCDTTQVVGKHVLDDAILTDVFWSGSGHKLGGLTGCGFLVLPYQDQFPPLIAGGGQETNLRGGTQNYLAIETLAIALDWHQQNRAQWQKIAEHKKEFEYRVRTQIPGSHVIGETSMRLANTSMISFNGLHGQGLQIALEEKNIFVTTSSACSDNEPNTSRVLTSMGISDDEGRSVLRISTGLEFNLADYLTIAEALSSAFQQLSRIRF